MKLSSQWGAVGVFTGKFFVLKKRTSSLSVIGLPRADRPTERGGRVFLEQGVSDPAATEAALDDRAELCAGRAPG